MLYNSSMTFPKLRIDSHLAVIMRDETVLYADVYRPETEAKVPVLVVRTPYGVQRDGGHEDFFRFAHHGFAVVVQDVRGRFESDGSWDPFRNEATDGYDTIEWAAKQPWSNGNVGTQGGSYLGNNQWLTGALAPPSLRAMFPRVASTSIYHNWAFFGGAFRLSFNFGWAVVRMPHRIMQPQYWHTESYTGMELDYETILLHVPLKDGDLESSNCVVPHYREWLAHPNYDSYWSPLSVEDKFNNINIPVHTFGGWYDIFLAGTINGYTGMQGKGAKMTIGPWGHGPSQQFGELDFGPAAMRHVQDVELPWFQHYLQGVDNGIERAHPVEIFYMGANQWKQETAWPIASTRYRHLYINNQKILSFELPHESGSDTYIYDPADPVPTLGGNNCCGSPTIAGPVDQRPLASRQDVKTYTSRVIVEPLAIAGPVQMNLFGATDGLDTDWMVKLIDVYPDGRAFNIAEGILRARFRDGFAVPKLLTPNSTYEFTIDMVATANVFLAGHKISITITSSNFPQFDRNPNTGSDLGSSPSLRIARNTIYWGGLHASHITLPIVPLP